MLAGLLLFNAGSALFMKVAVLVSHIFKLHAAVIPKHTSLWRCGGGEADNTAAIAVESQTSS